MDGRGRDGMGWDRVVGMGQDGMGWEGGTEHDNGTGLDCCSQDSFSLSIVGRSEYWGSEMVM